MPAGSSSPSTTSDLILNFFPSENPGSQECHYAWSSASSHDIVNTSNSSNPSPSVTQLCPTLCDAIDCSLPDSSVHGILQASILSELPFSSPRDLPDPELEPGSSALQEDSLPSEPPGKSTVSDLTTFLPPPAANLLAVLFVIRIYCNRGVHSGDSLQDKGSFTASTDKAPRGPENEALPSLPLPWVPATLKLKHSPGWRALSAPW